ncbi:MAG TPA: hypothetical protein VFD63_01600 [Pyrinomonadaceae bacterium]|nr:hypothetical protein [Pyrinomonadaceae bacterium]
MLWWLSSGLIALWFVLAFLVHKRGWVHMLLLAGFAFLVIQIAAYRKTKYQRSLSNKS